MREGKKWNKEEIEFLCANYPIVSPEILCEKLKRSVLSIYVKAGRLKLKKEIICRKLASEEEKLERKLKSEEYRKKYREENKEKIKERTKKWYRNNKDYCMQKQRDRLKNPNERKKRNEYMQNKKYNDVNYRLSLQLRNRFTKAVQNQSKKGSAVKDLGCTIEKFILWIEMNWKEGMSWDNWGLYGWHIDHIKPLSSFDLTDRNQLLEACHYANLQPLWAKDNLSKGKKYAL